MIALVTPVHGRIGLTRIVFEQRRRLLSELQSMGIDACQVVVGDDANMDIAQDFGFHVVGCHNVLGARINTGFLYSFEMLGADHVVFCGSDSWLLPGWLADLPPQGKARASGWLTLCSDEIIASMPASPAWGFAPWTLSRDLLEPFGFEPVPNDRERLLDSAILDALGSRAPHRETFVYHGDDDPLRVVDFRNGPWEEQMTSLKTFMAVYATTARRDPWDQLVTRFPDDLVDRMKRFYAGEGS